MELGVTVGGSIERIEATAKAFDFVEFGLGEAIDPTSEINTERLCAVCEEYDVGIEVHLPFKQVVATAVPEYNEAIVAHQRRLLSWAGEIGADKAVLHGTVRNASDTALRQPFAEQLSRIVEIGYEHGVEVVIENVGHQKRGLPLSVLGDLAREADAPVCFDVGHAYMEGGNDAIGRFLGNHADLVSHVHVHDARSRGDTHIPAGAGEIEFESLSEYCSDFDGTVSIEVFTDDAALLEDTAKRVAPLVGYEWTD
jgi:sugar phosphate isomerase/epimerase